MHKRLVISICLLMAFAMLQAHNFIPHQHKVHPPAKHSHHQDQHEHQQHHNGKQGDDHHTPLTDFSHNADLGKVISNPHFEKQGIQKLCYSEGLLFQLYDKLATLKSPHRPHPPDGTAAIHIIFLSRSLPLRAPPVAPSLS